MGNSKLMRKVTRILGNLRKAGAGAAASAALPVALPGNSVAATGNMLLQICPELLPF